LRVSVRRVQPEQGVLDFAKAHCSRSDMKPPPGERLDQGSLWLGAFSGKKVLGVAAFRLDGEDLRVTEICPGGSQGIGASLLDGLVREARASGKQRVIVVGVDRREPVQRDLLEAGGFRIENDFVRMEWMRHDLPDPPVPEGYEVRTYREGDEAYWAECMTRAYSTTPHPSHFTAERIRRIWIYTPNFIRDGCFFALKEERVVGAFMAWRQVSEGPRRGRLHWLGVDPDHRHRGLAKILTVRALRYLLREGLTSIFLETAYAFDVAMRMYGTLGFVERARLFDYVRDL